MFATERIPKNKRIIHYGGEKITHKESRAREARYLDRERIWCFRLDNRWVIDGAVNGNLARFINHSCTPNCYAQIIDRVIWIRAARTIEAVSSSGVRDLKRVMIPMKGWANGLEREG